MRVSSRPVVVIGHGAEAVATALGDRVTAVLQEPQRGTADAVRVGIGGLDASVDRVLVTMGDVPMQPSELYAALIDALDEAGAAIALVSARVADPSGYGRVVRDAGGGAAAIVEEVDADEATRAIGEVNAGTYAFDAAWLREAIHRVPASASGEYYLTDLVALAVADRRPVAVVVAIDPDDTMGINDRVALSVAEERMRRRINERHMRDGVTIVDPATTRIDATVEIGQDARIEPGTTLQGATVIAQDAVIGPNAHVRDSRIGPRTTCGPASWRPRSWPRMCRSVRTPTCGRGPRWGRAAASATSRRSRSRGSGLARSSTISATSATRRSATT